MGLVRCRKDRLRGHPEDVGVPTVAENTAGGVVEDEVVADVYPVGSYSVNSKDFDRKADHLITACSLRL